MEQLLLSHTLALIFMLERFVVVTLMLLLQFLFCLISMVLFAFSSRSVHCGEWSKSLNESLPFAHCRITHSFAWRPPTHTHTHKLKRFLCMCLYFYVAANFCCCSLLITSNLQQMLLFHCLVATRCCDTASTLAHTACHMHKHTHTHTKRSLQLL